MNKGYCMDESKKQTLEKTFKDIRKEKKKRIISGIVVFIVSFIPGLVLDFMRNGYPENTTDFILTGIKFAAILLIFYEIFEEGKCFFKWNNIKNQQIEILKEELNTPSGDITSEEKIKRFMSEFVDNTNYVDAIQIHSYNFIAEGQNVTIPIKLERQYLRKGKRHYLNAVTNYYEIDLDIFKRFDLIKRKYENKSIGRIKVLSDIEELIVDISNNKTEEHIEIYKLLIGTAAKINEYIGEDYGSEDSALQQIAGSLIQEISDNEKRTGILGGVLYTTGYLYEYKKGNVLKENRKY